MKKNILMVAGVVLVAGALTACSVSVETTPFDETEAETTAEVVVETEALVDEGEMVGLANPWIDTDADGLSAATGFNLVAPEDAAYTFYSYDENDNLAQLVYGVDERDYVFRAQATDAAEDISGNYYEWDEQQECTVGDCDATFYAVTVEADGEVINELQMVNWYDEATGTSYSLGVAGMNLDGFDILEVAETLYANAQ